MLTVSKHASRRYMRLFMISIACRLVLLQDRVNKPGDRKPYSGFKKAPNQLYFLIKLVFEGMRFELFFILHNFVIWLFQFVFPLITINLVHMCN